MCFRSGKKGKALQFVYPTMSMEFKYPLFVLRTSIVPTAPTTAPTAGRGIAPQVAFPIFVKGRLRRTPPHKTRYRGSESPFWTHAAT